MIAATAVCPHPPLLLRELTGVQDVTAELREICESAVSSLLATPGLDVLVVVGGADASGEHVPGAVPVRVYGGTGTGTATGGREGEDRAPLPLSLGVARRLLDSVGHDVPVETVTAAWDASAEEIGEVARAVAARADRVGLLVMGDGSARWGVRASDRLDGRAREVDETVHRALTAGDGAGLLGLDPALAADVRFQGRAALQVMAAAVEEGGAEGGAGLRSEVLYADDPFGVTYFVAVWSCVSS